MIPSFGLIAIVVVALLLGLGLTRRSRLQVAQATEQAGVAAITAPPTDPSTATFTGGLLSRAPILDRAQQMVAYDLLLPAADLEDKILNGAEVAQFARQLLEALYGMDLRRLGERRVHVPVPHDILRSRYVELLPASHVVLTLKPGEQPWLAERCRELRALNYQISVDLGLENAGSELIEVVHYVRLPVDQYSPLQLRDRVGGLLRRNATLIATGVNTHERYTHSQELGFSFFRGYYFAVPQALGARSLSPRQGLVSRVVNLLARRAEAEEIENLVKQDVGFSYELMRYANSAAHGLRSEVTSLRQGLTLLGHKRLLRWVALYLLGRGQESSSPGHEALYATCLQRGRTLELLAEGRLPRAERELMFLVGAFSMLDLLLQVPLEQAIADMGLPVQVQETLLEEQGALVPYLRLAQALENGDQAQSRALMPQLDIEPAEVNRIQLDAMAWVEGIIQDHDARDCAAA